MYINPRVSLWKNATKHTAIPCASIKITSGAHMGAASLVKQIKLNKFIICKYNVFLKAALGKGLTSKGHGGKNSENSPRVYHELARLPLDNVLCVSLFCTHG